MTDRNDQPGVLERLVSALWSRNLKDRRSIEGRVSESDVLRLGAAGMAAHRVPLPMALFELKYRVPAAQDEANHNREHLELVVAGLGKLVRKRADLERWRLRRSSDTHQAVLFALHWWLLATCPACKGRQYEAIPGTPTLSDRQCRVCHGQGKRPIDDVMRDELPVAQREALSGPVLWLVAQMDRMEIEAGDEYIRKLGRVFRAAKWLP
jgi:hypothetical protein